MGGGYKKCSLLLNAGRPLGLVRRIIGKDIEASNIKAKFIVSKDKAQTFRGQQSQFERHLQRCITLLQETPSEKDARSLLQGKSIPNSGNNDQMKGTLCVAWT